MSSHGGRRCCGWCKFLYGLVTESIIITLTFIHALSTVVEVLINRKIITDPTSTVSTTITTSSTLDAEAEKTTANSSSSFDPGGCPPFHLDRHLEIAVQVFQYFTLVVSSLFMLEVFLKIIYSRIAFIKDVLQIVDLLVVMASLGLEILFYVMHDKLLNCHPEIVLAGLIVLFRLWRIPRACNIQKEEYAKRLESEMHYLRNEKINQERKFKELEDRFKKQMQESKQHKNAEAKHNGISIHINDTSQCNGSAQKGILYEKIQATLPEEPQSKHSKSRNGNATSVSNGDLPRSTPDQSKEEADQKKASKDPEVDSSPKDQSGDKDSFNKKVYHEVDGPVSNDQVFVDVDSSAMPHRHIVQEVEIHFEEAHMQHQLPSVSYRALDHEEQGIDTSLVGMDNGGYDESDEHGDEMDLVSVTEDGTRTYRSADGIPMTDL
ncbi:hypothetical protein CHS0354_001278 [Potamilus streckersoni]|uniref:Hydrogen voltage-gated channel 1 n=1 Tax=Potamilus streckersoni TaxID=2493646 RepID=A0AAE0VRP6_9BIVA|nr:hypothetical protein CHS0354_001278 [Potamilus streckersoni]